MLSNFLKKHITSQASFVEYGYGQVEPNHLSAQRTAQIYGQLPADPAIQVLEQGQFVKYDYASGLVNFTGAGEWMLVYNETKLYRGHQMDCEFAMIKDNYQARLYSPINGDTNFDRQTRYYNGKDSDSNTSITVTPATYKKTTDEAVIADKEYFTLSGTNYIKVAAPTTENIATYYEVKDAAKTYKYDDITAKPDMYEIHYNEDPFHIESDYKPQRMPEGTSMVPRVFKTNVGDIFTTNTVDETNLSVGDLLTPGANGILTKTGAQTADMKWQVVKVYTMPDHQKGVKLQRIA